MSVHAMRKVMTTHISQAHRKATSQNPQESNTQKQVGEVGEPYSDSGHEIWATGIHESHVLQASIHHLHRTRRGRWLHAGVSEINLRNSALNHTIRRSLHNPFQLNIWLSGTWTMTGKMWAVQMSRLKVSVSPSSRETMPTREMITTLRTWAVPKASRHKAILSWTKTIWAMVRSMSELRWSTRRSARQSTWKSARRSTRVWARRNTRIRLRQNIKELIMIWVSSKLSTPTLNSLSPEAKLI
jgi:hypothetical protein